MIVKTQKAIQKMKMRIQIKNYSKIRKIPLTKKGQWDFFMKKDRIYKKILTKYKYDGNILSVASLRGIHEFYKNLIYY